MRGTVATQLNRYARSKKMTDAQRRALKRKHSWGERGGNAPLPTKHQRNVMRLGNTEINRRREKRMVRAKALK